MTNLWTVKRHLGIASFLDLTHFLEMAIISLSRSAAGKRLGVVGLSFFFAVKKGTGSKNSRDLCFCFSLVKKVGKSDVFFPSGWGKSFHHVNSCHFFFVHIHTLSKMGYHPYQLVQDSFHQQ